MDVDIDLGCFVHVLRRIRLVGINAPEMKSPFPEVREAAKASKEFLVSLAPSITSIKTVMDSGDKYGRLLGTLLTKHETAINSMMILEGHALPYK